MKRSEVRLLWQSRIEAFQSSGRYLALTKEILEFHWELYQANTG